MIVKLWKGSSKWTSAGRNHAIHLAEDSGAACKKQYVNGCLDRWDGDSSEITCKKCKAILKQKNENQLKDLGFNYLPPFSEEITEEKFRYGFFHYCLKKHEYRQAYYNNDYPIKGTFTCRVFFLDYPSAQGLGYIIADDWKAEKVKYYRCGAPEKWNEWNEKFAKNNG